MMKITGMKVSAEIFNQAMIIDQLNLMMWSQSGAKGQKPELYSQKLLGIEETGTAERFASPEDFEAEWERRTGVKYGKRN